jgi:NAD(P)H dehydrogenase (quinone)
MKNRVLILAANPKQNSFTHSLAEAYARGARQNNEVQLLDLSQMVFDLDLSQGYAEDTKFEASLTSFQQSLKWCDHLVIFSPIWWGALPAKLKGLIDRTFLPGFAFQYAPGKAIPKKLLLGKTARVVLTMDTPPWYYRLVQGAPAIHQLKSATLKFVGFKSVKSNLLGPIISSTERAREKWLEDALKWGVSAR